MTNRAEKSVLVVIPARGGSKGIPRKNLRTLGGRPLLSYSVETALRSSYEPIVLVSSDDAEILAVSAKLGAETLERDPALAADATTLDPVIAEAYSTTVGRHETELDAIVTLQPTSPLLRTATLDRALDDFFSDESIDTVISAKNDTHLTWRKDGDRFIPNYEKRVNRQELPQVYRETGGFLITRPKFVTKRSRIGQNVSLYLLSPMEAIDIDDYTDWALCEYFLNRKRILFVVAGDRTIGLGHAYNALTVASDILGHELQFLVTSGSELARDRIASHNYPVIMQREGVDLLDEIASFSPDLVINDILDTSAEYVRGLKSLGVKVVNFEDLGDGAREADLVINAIYPEKEKLPRHYFGQQYFLLRDEFLVGPATDAGERVKNVLVTFGGVDPCDLTRKVLSAITTYCANNDIDVNVVAGFGYERFGGIASFEGVTIHRDVKNISDHMAAADVIFTSAGRTVYEVASVGRPAIILAQNERELLHFFASDAHGFTNLGLGSEVSEETIVGALVALVENPSLRRENVSRMKKTDFRSNRKRVVELIAGLLENRLK